MCAEGSQRWTPQPLQRILSNAQQVSNLPRCAVGENYSASCSGSFWIPATKFRKSLPAGGEAAGVKDIFRVEGLFDAALQKGIGTRLAPDEFRRLPCAGTAE